MLDLADRCKNCRVEHLRQIEVLVDGRVFFLFPRDALSRFNLFVKRPRWTWNLAAATKTVQVPQCRFPPRISDMEATIVGKARVKSSRRRVELGPGNESPFFVEWIEIIAEVEMVICL